MLIVLVPLIAYIYHHYNNRRKILYLVFFTLGIMSLAAVVIVTIKYNVDGYPGFMS